MSDFEKSIGDEKTLDGRQKGAHRYSFTAGDRLGSYQVIRPLGAGGMGEVYLVEHTMMHKRYALKVLPNALFGSSQFADRFRVEARVMADLQHPHIVQVHHMDETPRTRLNSPENKIIAALCCVFRREAADAAGSRHAGGQS